MQIHYTEWMTILSEWVDHFYMATAINFLPAFVLHLGEKARLPRWTDNMFVTYQTTITKQGWAYWKVVGGLGGLGGVGGWDQI